MNCHSDLHAATADVLERANLTAAAVAVVFAAGSSERARRSLMLQDALLRRGFDCLAREIRIDPASVRTKEIGEAPNQKMAAILKSN